MSQLAMNIFLNISDIASIQEDFKKQQHKQQI